jgi:hypothetical protein
MEERMAVIESKQRRSELDINRLFDFFRKHMEQEENDRKESIATLHSLDKKLDIHKEEFKSSISQQRSFLKGAALVATIVWSIITAVLVTFL